MLSSSFIKNLLRPSLLIAVMFAVMFAVLLPGDSQAQAPKFKKPAFGQKPEFGDLSGLGTQANDELELADFTATAVFKIQPGSNAGVLEVRCNVREGSHTYSLTQPKGAGKKTRILLDDSDDYSIDPASFRPDKEPHLVPFPDTSVKAHEHHGRIVFSAPIKIAKGVKAESLEIPVKITGIVCEDGIGGMCSQFSEQLTAKHEEVLQAAPPAGAIFTPKGMHLELQGNAFKVVDGNFSSGPLQPGDKVRIELVATPQGAYHVYPFSTDISKKGSATFLALQETGNWGFTGPNTLDIPDSDEYSEYHEQPVTWEYVLTVPAGFSEESNLVTGIMGLQTCTHEGCDRPLSVAWQVEIPVGQPLQNVEFQFSNAGSFKASIEAVKAEPELLANVAVASTDNDSQTADTKTTDSQTADNSQAISSSQPPADAGKWASLPLWQVLPLAFVAGFILNFMPCVLPVIGLKVMSFVYQAGQNPRQIFLLNAMFCLGMVSVFMILAFFAVSFGLGWGEQFQGLTFKIIMIAVVVVFGLSFFGVWEIPIPGFSGGGVDQKEGLTGAFLKGILTTILATPCSGPMLIPAVIWATAQPPTVTYLVFLALGLGMGAPYLVIGVYPKLVSKLPQPGPWMETFKQVMGFIMLGTAIFLMGAVEHKYVVSVLTMLLILGFACWWMGRTSLAAPLGQRLKAWTISAAIGVFAVWFSFSVLLPEHELEYQQFTRLTFDEHIEEGSTVFVDFTADW